MHHALYVLDTYVSLDLYQQPPSNDAVLRPGHLQKLDSILATYTRTLVPSGPNNLTLNICFLNTVV